jgi:hypothetical protein
LPENLEVVEVVINSKEGDPIYKITFEPKVQLKNSTFKVGKIPPLKILTAQESINSPRGVFGFGCSDFHSSSSLQHSVPTISFPKAKRFQDSNASHKNSGHLEKDYIISLPSIFDKSKKLGTSLGYGSKQPFPVSVLKNAESNPGPGNYTLATKDNKYAGPTFGLSYEFYKKVHVHNRQTLHPDVVKDLPGPHAY